MLLPVYWFQIEDYEKDDLNIQVRIEGRPSIQIPIKAFESFLKRTGRLDLHNPDNKREVWGQMNVVLYWEHRSEFFVVQDLSEYILQHHDLLIEIMEGDI
jgi:hypothetical protein